MENSTFKLSDEQIKILEEELLAYSLNPKEGSSWEDIKKKLKEK